MVDSTTFIAWTGQTPHQSSSSPEMRHKGAIESQLLSWDCVQISRCAQSKDYMITVYSYLTGFTDLQLACRWAATPWNGQAVLPQATIWHPGRVHQCHQCRCGGVTVSSRSEPGCNVSNHHTKGSSAQIPWCRAQAAWRRRRLGAEGDQAQCLTFRFRWNVIWGLHACTSWKWRHRSSCFNASWGAFRE